MGSPRCIEIDGDVGNAELDDPSLTVLDRVRFHLPKSFLAARGRRSGSDTATGWTLAHGGLLPEEVVIPVLEWFGDEDLVCWPNVAFPDGAEFDRNRCLLPVLLSNPYSRPLNAGSDFRRYLRAVDAARSAVFLRWKPGAGQRLSFQLAAENLPDGEKLAVDVTIRIHAARGRGESIQTRQYLVERAKRLVELVSVGARTIRIGAPMPGTIAIGISGSGRPDECLFPSLGAGAKHRLSFQLAGGDLPDGRSWAST